ncbi:hypothetical protein RMATCC62417_05012 [Rhizopus microsporus]|nr:hypothetical protein RMATCC62417_05012 [Rhizopus microsporus]
MCARSIDLISGAFSGACSVFLPLYQNHIKILKDDGYTIIGYIRKSPGSEAKETRNNLLQAMSSKLKERSLVDVVLASPCCRAFDPIERRDLKTNEEMEGLDVSGNVQG